AGRIDGSIAVKLGQPLLARVEVAPRIRVLPADVVPIADVQRKRNDARGGARIEMREPAICGWTTGTALRGGKLDQGLGMSRAAGLTPGADRQSNCQCREHHADLRWLTG